MTNFHFRYRGAAMLAGAFAVGPPLASAAPPPLPTACFAGSCGSAVPPFVQAGVVNAVTSGQTMTINQSTSKAILNWANFNIANGYAVRFLQPGSTSAVLNKIWSGDPSVIAGQLSANGQVYLYNQNGIVFDKGAQVDVGGLVASTLPLKSDDLFLRGILADNPLGFPPPAVFVAPDAGAAGAVTVRAGATLATSDGGRIVLLGSAVTNQGSIATPDGQAILGAATNNVYLAASSNPDMRGLLIAVDGGGTTGTVTNEGQISAAHGNITLAGLMVNQEGLLSATTSVSANGSIYLIAGDAAPDKPYFVRNTPTAFGGLLPSNGGTLVLAPGSVTEILPDTADTSTLTVPQLQGFIPSEVDLAGKDIALEGNATIHAAGGVVNAYATSNLQQLIRSPTQPVTDDGSIYLDHDSVIDVSGLQNVQASATQNILQVTLESIDLQNAPLLRSGFLHGAKVTVDINHPPALFDVTPYANNIGANIAQISTRAGAIQLFGTGDVIARSGSTLNVSGGSIAYQGGYAASTTNLLGADGKVYNISTAPNNVQYVGIASDYGYVDPTWGTSSQGSQQTYYSGYLKGMDAGTITVRSPQLYLRGDLLGQTVAGLYQRTAATLPAGGTLVLGCSTCSTASQVPNFGLDGGLTFTNSLGDTLNADVLVGAVPVSSTAIPANSLVSPDQLSRNGFTTLDVSSNGAIVLPQDATIQLASNGALNLRSTESIAIGGKVLAPGGTVQLQTVNTNDLLKHDIDVASGAIIDTGGNWTNDSPAVTPQPGTGPVIVNGGKVSLSAAGDVSVGSGAIVNVSGGGWVNSANKLSSGNAGSISLSANFNVAPGFAPYTGTLAIASDAALIGGSLKPGGGGTLSLQSGAVTIGAARGVDGELVIDPALFARGGFGQYKVNGQNSLMIGNADDASGAHPVNIAPLQQTLVLDGTAMLRPTGSNLLSFSSFQTLPLAQRAAASVSFTASASSRQPGVEMGDVTLARDASIVVDPQGSVTLGANGYNGNLLVYGDIVAPAGNITLQLVDPSAVLYGGADPGFIADQRIEIGSDATLSAAGYARIDTLNPQGYRQGAVLGGGTISLLATKGFIQTDAGSSINVDGAAGTLDVAGQYGVTPTTVASSGGVVNLAAREGFDLQGTLSGKAATQNGVAVSGAGGGTVNIGLGNGFSNAGPNGSSAQNAVSSANYPTDNRVLTLVGTGAAAPVVGDPLQSGVARIDATELGSGGFDTLSLRSADTIAFEGTVSLHAGAKLTLDAPQFLANPGAQVNVSAAYVALGNYYNNLDYFDQLRPSPNAAAVLHPVGGDGEFAVQAQLLDLRGISGWSGFAAQTLSSSGDIRLVSGANPYSTAPALGAVGNLSFEGALNTTGTLDLHAAQVYPTTATPFAINDLPATAANGAAPTPGVVNIDAAGAAASPASPLSAGGSLTINATEIHQSGVVRAPFGAIVLNGISSQDAAGNVVDVGQVTLADGSVTSVSSGGQLIPYGSTANGTQWTYSPYPGLTSVLAQPPDKKITLTGPNVDVQSGAQVDLSGGGDLYAYEFIAGQGGSKDVLDPQNLPASAHPAGTVVYSYAIIPTLGSQYAPIDPQYAQGSPATGNQTIYLSGVPGLAAGTYALLPARYAALPGAYAIQVVQSNSGITPGASVAQPDGSYLVAARFGVAGTSTVDTLSSSVLVAPSAVVHNASQYSDAYANLFFTQAAAAGKVSPPQLPADAGELLLSVSNSLNLLGDVSFNVGQYADGKDSSGKPVMRTGQAGDVAIIAQDLVVVDSLSGQPAAAPGTVELDVHQLDNLQAQTLILGASNASTRDGQQLTLGATQSVDLRNTTALVAPQIVVAARDDVTVESGAQLIAQGNSASAASTPAHLVLPGGGALLRVSSGAGASVEVDPSTVPQSPSGTVTIASGATVQASGSLVLYGTKDTVITPGATVSAPDVSLYSSEVSIGDAPAGTSGLVISSALLAELKDLTDLTIGSSSSIDFYNAVQLGTAQSGGTKLHSVSFDAPVIAGHGTGNKTVEAGTISLFNTSSTQAPQAEPADGSGALNLVATSAGGAPGQITLGSGNKAISGFGALSLQADGDIVGQGSGSLQVAAAAGPVDVDLRSAALIGTAASKQSLTTTGQLTLIRSTAATPSVTPAPGLGASISLQGSSIDQDGAINLPSGSVTLRATSGDVHLGAGSTTAANGAVADFSGTKVAAAGGTVSLVADVGNVVIDSGASVDVSGARSAAGASSDAGGLLVLAAQGQFVFAGNGIQGGADAGQQSGSFTLDVGSGLAGQGLSKLDAMLAAGGFHGDLALRTRNDAQIGVSDSIRASSLEVAADNGSIDVQSGAVIDTSGSGQHIDGGTIALWAGHDLTVENGATLNTRGVAAGPMGANGQLLAARGGDVTLGASQGTVQLGGGSSSGAASFDLRGSDSSADGTLTLRASRTADESGVQLVVPDPASVVVHSGNAIVVEGVQRYAASSLGAADAGCGSGGSCDIADTNGALALDAGQFLSHAQAIATSLGLPNAAVRAGIEIDSNNDLVVGDGSGTPWDLAAWNAALGAPVTVSLRAAGNLIVNTSISDGFTNNGRDLGLWTFGEPGATPDSGSLRLAASADLAAVNPMATVTQPQSASSYSNPGNSGNLLLAPRTVVRTGTGNIDMAAGGDVLLGYTFNGYDANGNLQVAESDPLSAAVYTAGSPSALSAAQAALFTPSNLSRRGGAVPAYPARGGNIRITAAGDVRSAPSAQLVTDWLWRRGALDGTFSPDTNTSWWVMFNLFQQGVGALGGGGLEISAGRDILNTSAVIPATGRLLTAAGSTGKMSDLVLTGGGHLKVDAGGDIISGVFEDDWGNAELNAGGAITSGPQSTFGQQYPNAQSVNVLPPPDTQIYPIVVAGNGTFEVSARGAVELAGVANSTTLPITIANADLAQANGTDAAFFTYAPTARPGTLAIQSVGGDVTLGTQALGNIPIAALADSNVYDGNASPNNYLAIYPPEVDVAALSGDVNLGSASLAKLTQNNVGITLFPAASGNLQLLAAGSINNDGTPASIALSEVDPTRVPNVLAPSDGASFDGLADAQLPAVPLHQADRLPVLLIASGGNIAPLSLTLPKQANVIAGGDIDGLDFTAKNINPSDVTLIEAGGDISYSTPTAPVTNALVRNNTGIRLAGPGQLEVLAGGTINLGDSNGVRTTGSLSDPRLQSTGASMLIGAGLGTDGGKMRQPAYQAFIVAYLDPSSATGAQSSYASTLVAYMRQLDPAAYASLSYTQALQAFKALTPGQQLPLLARVLSDELSATGIAHSVQGTNYDRGYQAIETLFPTKDAAGNAISRSGDLNMFFSQLKTEQGGDISLLVPGGSVVVGVPNPPASLAQVKAFTTPLGLTVPAEVNLGILVLGQGAIRGFADRNFEVNQSRILTLEGGDIILWASNGNIDAGKGAKSASGAPPPVIQTDANGNLFVDPSNAVAGSGIGQLLTSTEQTAGLVNLIAPKGAVDAGDAGIRVAGNLNIAALQVIGAANITVVGTSTGVPTSDAGALSGALSGANSLGDASKNAVDQLGQGLADAGNYQQLSDSLQPVFINVKMFCLGLQCETQ